jgi:diguanylate cyclase (GGDEF)-like protein
LEVVVRVQGEEMRTQDSPRRFATLDVLNAITNSGFTIPGLSRLLVGWVLETLPAEKCSFTVDHPRGPRIRFEACAGDDRVSVGLGEPDSRPSNRSFEAVGHVTMSDHATEPGSNDAAVLEMSVGHRGERFGIVAVRARAGTVFEAEHRAMFEAFAQQFGFLFAQRLAMEQAQNQASHDELTGLYNRRHLHKALAWVIPRAREQRFPVSLLFLDIDHFKTFNDTWGHALGDRVLRMLGDLMRSLFRTYDVVCRYGGEEFAVLLCDHRTTEPSRHPTQVLQFAERLRREAEMLTLTSPDGQILSHITISGGIATYPWDAASAEELIQKADEALYRAKRSGRNRIFLVNPQPVQEAV